jgi:hypothetical protein
MTVEVRGQTRSKDHGIAAAKRQKSRRQFLSNKPRQLLPNKQRITGGNG